MYIKSELIKILRSKRAKLFLSLIFLMPLADLAINIFNIYGDYLLHKEAYVTGFAKSTILHPAYASYLSGSSIGHIPQMLLIWVLPIYLMIIYSDSYIREVREGYAPTVFSRMDRKRIIKDRFKLSFILPFVASFLSLLVNFLLSHIAFWGGSSMNGLEMYIETQDFFAWSIQNANIAYIGYVVVYSLIAGGCGVICTGISFLFPNNKIAYALVFFLWIVQIISPYSLTYAMQPFIEYGPEYFIPALLIFVGMVVGVYSIAYIYKVKFDEI